MFRKEGESRKSRDQKFREFFEVLQLEYIVAELRYRIYLDEEKKQKSLDIMEMKKKKILDIAVRNSMKTIFEDCKIGCTSYYDERLRKELYARIYPEIGLPNFIYRDDTHRRQIEFLDKKFYFSHGTVFNTPDGQGQVKWTDFINNTVKVEVNGSINIYPVDKIVRVFVGEKI